MLAAIAPPVLELAAQPAMQLLEQIARRRLTEDEEREFAEAIALAMRNAMPAPSETHSASISGLKKFAAKRRADSVSKKAAKGLRPADARSASISGLAPDGHSSSRDRRERLQRDERAVENLNALALARAELTTSRSARTPDLWRHRLFATLVERGREGRGTKDWSLLLGQRPNSNGGEYSDEQVLEWATAVVAGFEALARARETLKPLLEALDRQDQQVIQITTLEAMQGMRRTVALALWILVLAVPVDAEALHLLL